MVEQLIDSSSGRKTLHDTILRKIPDLESLSIKLSDKRAGLSDLYKVYAATLEITKMADVIGQVSCLRMSA
jgi:DNA mismatch repair ATPase MutS